MLHRRLYFLTLITGFGLVSAAQAHYLWIAIDTKSGEHGATNIYFEESPAPGDGFYLEPFAENGRTWIRTIDQPQPAEIKTTEIREPKKRWLTAPLRKAGPRSVDSYGKFGVYRYGKSTDVLLHYYARCLDVDSHEQLHELARAEHLNLDMVVHDDGADVDVKVLWMRQPAEECTIFIRGPKGFKKNIKTSENGTARFTPEAEGRYLLRTNVEEKTPGRDGGKDYSLIRHHATLSISLPLKK